jgi:hypothetical protein
LVIVTFWSPTNLDLIVERYRSVCPTGRIEHCSIAKVKK